jgi:hypothetical protein
MHALNEHLPDIVSRYANKHTIDNFMGRTAFTAELSSASDSTP